MTSPSSIFYEARQKQVDQLVARYRTLAARQLPEVVRDTMLDELSRGPTWWRPRTWWKRDCRRHVSQYALLIVAIERLAVRS